jgi:hypothetical protein
MELNFRAEIINLQDKWTSSLEHGILQQKVVKV